MCPVTDVIHNFSRQTVRQVVDSSQLARIEMALASGQWLEREISGAAPSPRYGHTLALAGNVAFLFGGASSINQEEDKPVYFSDFYMLTENLLWQKWEDIYWFGGRSINEDGTVSSSNEIHKLSIAKMKWKVPLYVGIPPARRHGHTAFILHSHLYVFGGKNEEQEFNDLKVMRLINPSERQP
ncbi:hypothetical protein INR49_017468, partial [Caranx melampygus]